MAPIYPFILSGGSGTRLWPLSRRAFPKQFLPLTDAPKSLFQQSCRRLEAPGFAAPTVLGGNDHRFIIAEQMREIGITPKAIVLEPAARNTAPAAAIAALMAARESETALLLLLPSDHVIADAAAFRDTVLRGVPAAMDGALVTFGIEPTEPHTGYGYIETSPGGDALRVKRFVEKPDARTAATYLASGNFFWNAGIFLMQARALIEAFANHAPDILRGCERALASAQPDLDFLRLDPAAYAALPDISIDYAIMEKSPRVACVPLSAGWSDLGAWPAIWEIAEKDAQGNVARGDVIFHESRGSFAYTENACVAVVGLEDVMVVATKDAVLVSSKSHAQSVKAVVERLKAEGRPEIDLHKRVYRPWGWFEGLDNGDRFQVKRIMVKPGAQLSLQSHFHRAEHWIVVLGTLEVTIGDEVKLLNENQSTYIPVGARHRMSNPGRIPAYLIEVQSGAYLGEDDIVRYEDIYGRTDL
ncbi:MULTISPECIES: mannose-1-phosphate guanylyltransferase/mannose-6-phosphate isomerase [Rhodomicrobium]|uniref:mannose-1-phosphate guanylyltransferase/mannose-6-phosphate isomerase n=1 Tax=Rhodomicrobium TaxID=1068 RepID=UPI000B4A864B|nr:MULTISPECIES: mannose-1-phosphate guanylyltransferase/mannose-6-phosphate isomerase [Rhodomicrobium]